MAERMTMPEATIAFLGELRKAGVKSATLSERLEVLSFEFFPPQSAPLLVEPDQFAPDTLVPPPPEEDGPPNSPPRAERHYPVPASLAAILAKPSVS